jgi:WD40 repeat protein
VWAVQFDDQKIVSGAADKSIRLWVSPHTPYVHTNECSPHDGLPGGPWWYRTTLQDLATLQCTHSINGAHTDGISCLQFNENNIVSGAADSVVKGAHLSSLGAGPGSMLTCRSVLVRVVCRVSCGVCGAVWDMRTYRCTQTLRVSNAEFSRVPLVAGG